MRPETRKNINGIGWRFATFMVATTLFELGVNKLIGVLWPNVSDAARMNLNMLNMFLSVCVLGFLLISALMRDIPKDIEEKNKIPFGQFLIGICVCFTFMYAGAIVGNIFQLISTGSTVSPLMGIMKNGNLIVQVLEVGICAPIFEELIFRRLLCGSLSRYGKWFAVLTSGLVFGLFHGNFSQFFYATFLGFFFGFVYIRTGNIRYSIGYHMIINLSSALISTPLMIKSSENNTAAMFFSFWSIFQFLLAIVGFIFLIVWGRHIHFNDTETEIKKGKIFSSMFTSLGLWLVYLAGIALFVYYVLSTKASGVGKVFTDMSFTGAVTYTEETVTPDKDEFPFTIEKAGKYQVMVDFMDNVEPPFITGVIIEDAEGNPVDYFAADLASCTLESRQYEPGEYRIIFYYLTSEEEELEFLNKYRNIYDIEEPYKESAFEGFGGTPGTTYYMRYRFTMTKTS